MTHHTLKAYTDAGTFVLFDPGAVRHILRGEITLREFDIDREVNEGRVLAYSGGGDGDMLVRVYIDEQPDGRIEEHADDDIDGALLRVPTGRLIFSGLEDLSPVAEAAIDRSDDVEPRTGVAVRVPPGNYRIRGFDVEWHGEDERAVDAIKTPWDRRIDNWIGPAMGCGVFSTIFLVPTVLLIAGLSFGRGAFWSVLKYVVIAEVALWSVVVPLYWLASKRSTMGDPRREEIAAAHPPAVVVLTRLPESADLASMTGGQFGIGFEPGKSKPRGRPRG